MRAEPPITKMIIEMIPQADKILPEDALLTLDVPALGPTVCFSLFFEELTLPFSAADFPDFATPADPGIPKTSIINAVKP